MNPNKLIVFASGSGTNLLNIINNTNSNELDAKVVAVISNNSKSGALSHARDNKIPALHISAKTHQDPDSQILSICKQYDPKLIILAGYMKKIHPNLIEQYPKNILNIHPALLPKYGGEGMYGNNVHTAVFEAKETESGATVHLVNSEYDKGKILAQQKISILPTDEIDDIRAKVQSAEYELYPKAIADYLRQI
jgi:phosphoribosylglycinamide formyltransferase-1